MLASETNTATAAKSSGNSLNQATLDSFHGELSDAVSSTLEKFGIHPKDVNISISPASADPVAPAATSPDAPARTTPPTPGTAESTSENTSASASGAPNGGYDPFLQAAYNNPYQNAPAQTSTDTLTNTAAAPLDAQQIFDNNYWAQQPAAVQPLRTMQDQEQRAALATQLASEGYSIDVPIMVWGWDPSTVTSMRQAEGYTWVPSALQNPVEVAPGLPSMGTLTAYNSNNPPAGSIAV
jgi:hypothetical protein